MFHYRKKNTQKIEQKKVMIHKKMFVQVFKSSVQLSEKDNKVSAKMQKSPWSQLKKKPY